MLAEEKKRFVGSLFLWMSILQHNRYIVYYTYTLLALIFKEYLFCVRIILGNIINSRSSLFKSTTVSLVNAGMCLYLKKKIKINTIYLWLSVVVASSISVCLSNPFSWFSKLYLSAKLPGSIIHLGAYTAQVSSERTHIIQTTQDIHTHCV